MPRDGLRPLPRESMSRCFTESSASHSKSSTDSTEDTDFYRTQTPQKSQIFTDLLGIPMHINLTPFYIINAKVQRHVGLEILEDLFSLE